MTPPPIQLSWVPAGIRTDHDWEAPGVTAGAAHTVEYRRGDQPGSAVIIYVYPAWYDGEPGEFRVRYTFEWICGEDPGNPVGTETWSDSGHADLPAGYRTEDEAAAAAQRVAELLARCDYAALDTIVPGFYRDPLEWDGIPYDTQPATVP